MRGYFLNMEHRPLTLLRFKKESTFHEAIANITATSSYDSSLPDFSSSTPIFSYTGGLENQDSRKLRERVGELDNPKSPSALLPIVINDAEQPRTIEERLFDATASVKIFTSKVAMHLDKAWRDKLFQQLDSLHDPDEWESGDEPVQQDSFATFIKAIILIRPTVRPGLGLSHGGHLIAAWTSGKNRLTVEFLSNDRVRWVASRYPDGELEQFAGQTQVSRLLISLEPYSPEEWLFDAK